MSWYHPDFPTIYDKATTSKICYRVNRVIIGLSHFLLQNYASICKKMEINGRSCLVGVLLVSIIIFTNLLDKSNVSKIDQMYQLKNTVSTTTLNYTLSHVPSCWCYGDWRVCTLLSVP